MGLEIPKLERTTMIEMITSKLLPKLAKTISVKFNFSSLRSGPCPTARKQNVTTSGSVSICNSSEKNSLKVGGQYLID